jgi:hypothetical protein
MVNAETELLDQFNARRVCPNILSLGRSRTKKRVNSSGILARFWLFGNHVFVER